MEVSIFLAKVFAIYFLVTGIIMLLRKEVMMRFIKEIEHNPALITLIAFITLIIGALLVASHNVWQQDWTVLITIFAWITLLAGIIRLAFPDFIIKMAGKMANNSTYYTATIITLIIGLIFSYYGYYS